MENLKGWIVIALIAAIAWFAVWGRNTTLRYVVQYSADWDMVTFDRKPRDCEFLSAPMGRKDCHYEKVVAVELFRPDKDNGRPVISYDKGATWAWNDGGPTDGARVHVLWVKKEP